MWIKQRVLFALDRSGSATRFTRPSHPPTIDHPAEARRDGRVRSRRTQCRILPGEKSEALLSRQNATCPIVGPATLLHSARSAAPRTPIKQSEFCSDRQAATERLAQRDALGHRRGMHTFGPTTLYPTRGITTQACQCPRNPGGSSSPAPRAVVRSEVDPVWWTPEYCRRRSKWPKRERCMCLISSAG